MPKKRSLEEAAARAAENAKIERRRSRQKEASKRYYDRLTTKKKADRIRHISRANKKRFDNLPVQQKVIFMDNDARRNREVYRAKKKGVKLKPGKQSLGPNKKAVEVHAKFIVSGTSDEWSERECWGFGYAKKRVWGKVNLEKQLLTSTNIIWSEENELLTSTDGTWSEAYSNPICQTGHYDAYVGLPRSFWQCDRCDKGFWAKDKCIEHEWKRHAVES